MVATLLDCGGTCFLVPLMLVAIAVMSAMTHMLAGQADKHLNLDILSDHEFDIQNETGESSGQPNSLKSILTEYLWLISFVVYLIIQVC